MSLLSNALIDIAYYESMMGVVIDEEKEINYMENIINFTTSMFEKFCNRPLKARTFDYAPTKTVNNQEVDNPDYSPKYAVFDGILGTELYLPTYPANSVTTLIINDTTIPVATSYDDTTGYHLDTTRGRINYDGGFYFGYYKNIKIKWNGGYADNTAELEELKYLCFDMVKTIMNTPANTNLQSEKIGNYSYTNYAPSMITQLQGMNNAVLAGLKRYRKEVI